MERNKNEIDKKKHDPYYNEAYKSMKRSSDKSSLYKNIVKEYSKWECLIALQECSRH